MNGDQQRQRHLAVRSVEKRVDDLELVVPEIAKEFIEERDAMRAAITRGAEVALERHVGLSEAFLAFEHQTLWQRLRWLVRGR